MLNWIKKHKTSSAVALVVMGVIIGLGIAVRLSIVSKTGAVSDEAVKKYGRTGSRGDVNSLEEAFIKVADDVGPAVVSIVTEITQRIPARRYYFAPPGSPFDEDFERFFRDFFSETPEQEFKQQGLGSGVIIDKQGYIVTNDHVVGGAEKVTVILSDGRRFDAEVKGSDQRSDLAVIKIRADNLPVAKLGDSDTVKTGQWAIAIGNPFGFAVNNPKPTVTVGVVSALHRSLPTRSGQGRNYMDLIQTDAAINPGNSGGPLCDLDGKVIGINVAIFSTTGGYQGIGFAIPSNSINRVLGSLIEGKKIVYGWLGVTVQELSYDMAEYFKLKEKKGVIVIDVVKSGPADKSGIKSGDIIKTFNGEEINSLQKLLKLSGETEVGKQADVGIIRDGKEIVLGVVIGERPSEEALAKEGQGERPMPAVPKAEKWRGLTVAEIAEELARKYGIEKEAGVVIIDVESGSPAESAGLRQGLIVKELDKKAVNNIGDYVNAVKAAKGSVLIRTNIGYTIIKE